MVVVATVIQKAKKIFRYTGEEIQAKSIPIQDNESTQSQSVDFYQGILNSFGTSSMNNSYSVYDSDYDDELNHVLADTFSIGRLSSLSTVSSYAGNPDEEYVDDTKVEEGQDNTFTGRLH